MTSTEELERLHAIWQTGSDDAAADASNDIMEALPELLEMVRRYESALHEVIGLDHHNMGPESRAAKIARAAPNQEPTP